MQITWRASTRSVWMLTIFNISLIWRVDACRYASTRVDARRRALTRRAPCERGFMLRTNKQTNKHTYRQTDRKHTFFLCNRCTTIFITIVFFEFRVRLWIFQYCTNFTVRFLLFCAYCVQCLCQNSARRHDGMFRYTTGASVACSVDDDDDDDDDDFSWLQRLRWCVDAACMQACAPRYVYHSRSTQRRDPIGACYVSKSRTNSTTEYDPYAPCRKGQ